MSRTTALRHLVQWQRIPSNHIEPQYRVYCSCEWVGTQGNRSHAARERDAHMANKW